MTLFTDWNLLLLEEYFSPDNAGQDVWLSTNRAELESIGAHLGGAVGLIQAVADGPEWLPKKVQRTNIADMAKELAQIRESYTRTRNRIFWLKNYKDPGDKVEVYKETIAPTYLPYIALWVLAGSEVGVDGFYKEVSKLMKNPFPNNIRNKMEYVWSDLERWSIQEQNEKFGRFKVNIIGEQKFVGMAYAQTMVTDKDVDGLSRLFGSCRLLSGQHLNERHFKQLLEDGRNSDFLSAGLKSAMSDPNNYDHLKDVLTDRLEFWDGYVPKITNNSQVLLANSEASKNIVNDEALIVLRLKQNEEDLCWEIGYRVPAIVTGCNYKIAIGSVQETMAKLELMGTHIHSIESIGQHNTRQAINESATKEVELILSYSDREERRKERKFYLRKSKVRIFVWDSPDPALTDALLEREMPIAGAAYLFYSYTTYLNLEDYLINEEIQHSLVDIGGLPDDWGMICIENTENLTTEQRSSIIDEEPIEQPRARIRFVGGKPIVGSGSKKYAFYDLPIIELEAPMGAKIIADGLTFEERNFTINTGEVTIASTLRGLTTNINTVRRFNISMDNDSTSVFKIRVQYGEKGLCKSGLKVLAIGGIATAKRSHFSIDKFGGPLANNHGLCGAIINENTVYDIGNEIEIFQVNKFDISEESKNSWDGLVGNVLCQFLDSLSSTIRGFITYGVARDQIRRLAAKIGVENVEPALLLRELRRRGHIEIETDQKGHMVRICTVPPTIYSLPIKDNEQRQLYGICGSLRLQQWKEVSEAFDCKVYVEIITPYSLPVIRIATNSRKTIATIASFADFKVVKHPAQVLSQWLGSIQEIKENLTWYPEQGFSPNLLERLNPEEGFFKPAESMRVDCSRKYELFRYEAPQIQGARVYKLGKNLGQGFSEYSFIQDSRWGVWMAIGAFGKFVKSPPINITDASPWPLHYDSSAGTLWLPARMEPPFVIERALVLCSGGGPVAMQVISDVDGESIILSEENQRMIGKVSRVYSKMASGKWLCYRWVPNEIASKVASLLGGELKEIGCNTMDSGKKDEVCQSV
jgi:hypothetical protein